MSASSDIVSQIASLVQGGGSLPTILQDIEQKVSSALQPQSQSVTPAAKPAAPAASAVAVAKPALDPATILAVGDKVANVLTAVAQVAAVLDPELAPVAAALPLLQQEAHALAAAITSGGDPFAAIEGNVGSLLKAIQAFKPAA